MLGSGIRPRSVPMKKLTIRALCFLLILMLPLAGCAGQETQDKTNQAAPDLTVPDAQADDLTLSFDEASAALTVTDKRTGKVWSAGMTEEYYGQPLSNDLHKKAVASLFNVTYIGADNYISSVRSTDDAMDVTFTAEKDGVTARAAIRDTGIAFTVRFALRGNTLVASVPSDQIEETDDDRLTSIELLPFLGASVDSEDGYIVFPDGSGALYEFGPHDGAPSTYYQMEVYGNYFYDYDEYIRDVENGIKKVMLPVFGIKQGNGAVLAAITKGQAACSVRLSPSGYVYDAARVSPIFNYRYSYEMETANAGAYIIMQEKTREMSDFEVQYTFLAGEDADYSGMARTYRRFLLQNDLLRQSDCTVNVALDYLLSLQKPMMLWTENVAASDFAGGGDILELLAEKGIGSVKLNLLGWQKNGYNVYPSHFPVSRACGGSSGLQALLEKGNTLGAAVALNDNFFLAQSTQSGYSRRDDLAYNTKNKIYADNDETNFLMDVRAAKDTFTGSWVGKAKDCGVNAVNLDDIARTFYANGSTRSPLKRTETEYALISMLQAADEAFSFVGVSGGNLYGLRYADQLYDIPESSSRDFVFDRDIPFFQMVVHGYLPYTPEIPGNFSNDYPQTVLRWAEYGFVPYFSVAESSASALKDCYNEGVLVSGFADVQEKIIETSARFADTLGGLQRVAIHTHRVLDNGLTEVTYDNGASVLVNYGTQPIAYRGVTVGASDFCVVKN